MRKKKIKMGVLGLMLAPLFLFSCTKGYKDGPGLDLADVTDTQMVSPDITELVRTESRDGKTMLITWPFTYGAGGYEILYATIDVNDEVEEVVYEYPAYDGNTIVVPVAEDTRYLFSIKTLGNKAYNNTDAEEATGIMFGTAYELIRHFAPGEDIDAYFEANPVPQVDYGIKYTFEPGGKYTIGNRVDFKLSRVMLCASGNEEPLPENRPTILLDGSGFTTDGTGIKIKDLNFTYSGSNPFLRFRPMDSGESFEDHPRIDDNKWVTTYDPVVIQSCNIETHTLFNDGNQQYAGLTFYVKDCVISFNPGQRFMYFQKGLFKDMLFENTTVWGNGTGSQHFIQFSHSNRISANSLWTWSLNQTVEFKYCTFYNCAKTSQFFNSNQWNTVSGGIQNQATVTYTIFVDCGNKQVIQRLRANGKNINITCLNNNYWYDGSFPTNEIATNWDSSNTAIQTDPEFVNPTKGDFTVRGQRQRGFTGDPRWW